MKKVVSTEQVAHLWAYQEQSEARNAQSNFYFSGEIIFSYGSHFPICTIKKINGINYFFFTTRKYSNTTSKHIGIVHYSIPNRENIINVHDVPVYGFNQDSNVRELSAEIIEIKQKAKRARTAKERLNYEASAKIHNLKRFCELTECKFPDIFDSENFDLDKYIAEKEDKERKERIARIKEQKEKAEKQVSEWRNFERNYIDFSLPYDLLRLNGDKVETNRGVNVDKRVVKILWCMLQDGKDIIGRHVENFTIKSITGKEAKIGCHTFEMDEIKNLIITI